MAHYFDKMNRLNERRPETRLNQHHEAQQEMSPVSPGGMKSQRGRMADCIGNRPTILNKDDAKEKLKPLLNSCKRFVLFILKLLVGFLQLTFRIAGLLANVAVSEINPVIVDSIERR